MNKDEKSKKLKIALPLLILVSLLVWMPNLKEATSKRKQSKGLNASTASLDSNHLLDLISKSKQTGQKKKSAYEGWKRNPFIFQGWTPPQGKAIVKKKDKPILLTNVKAIMKEKVFDENFEEEESLKDMITLNGIFWNEHKPSVLVDDVVLGIGDGAKHYTIVNILPNKVIINDGVRDFEFYMNP